MSSCAVFANIYDAPLGDYQTLDVIHAIEYLYSSGVTIFHTVEKRHFEHLCEYWLDGMKDKYCPPEVCRFTHDDPYEKYFGVKYGTPDIFFADFILSDETTIYFVKNHMEVEYIVEYPKTKIYIVAKKKQLF